MDEPRRHPISDAVTMAHAALAGVADAHPWTMSDDQVADTLLSVGVLRAQVAELELRLAAHADKNDLGSKRGATSTAVWWARQTGQHPRDAVRRMRTALALDDQREVTRVAMARGTVTEEQASVIVAAVADLPADLDADLVLVAEKALVGHAALDLADRFDPVVLRRLGRRVLEVVAPDLAEDRERRVLEAEEEKANQTARLTLTDDGHGTCWIRGHVPSLTGEMLKKQLQSLWESDDARHTGPQALGQAFTRWVERYPADRLPTSKGLSTQLQVHLDVDQLTDALGAAGVCETDTGHRMTASQARMLACDSAILPVVLDGNSLVLDVGRKKRCFTGPQRIAIAARDKTCTAEGCDFPPGLCHYHHKTAWKDGGKTNIANGRLLCPKHHRMIHSGNYRVSPAEGGRLTFRRT